MHTQHARGIRPSMSVDFDQLKEAKTDGSIARLYRTQWGLDQSATGKVFCDEAECQERLNQGLLPPVLTAAQFSRISQGLPYGDMDDDLDPTAMIEASRAASPQVSRAASSKESPYRSHPSYSEFAALPAPVKEALRNDFKCFLFVKQRGNFDAMVDSVYARLGREAEDDARAEQKRRFEQELAAEAATPEFQALMARRKAKPTHCSRG